MPFLAVIFDPTKERLSDNFIGGWTPMKPMIFPFSCQVPENYELLSPTSQKAKNGGSTDTLFIQKYKNIFFRPSSNLDISKADWEFAARDVVVKFRLDCGALTVIEPDAEAVKNEPNGIGFRMFSMPDALKLVAHTKDLDTLEMWSGMEKRLEVQEAITKQKEAIESHLRMLRES